MGDAEPQHEWGRFLRRLTTKPSKWTIKSLAETSGLSRQTVSEYIRDGAESVTIGIIRRIADASGEDFLTTLLAAGNIPRYAEMAKAIEAMGVSEQERTELLTAAAGLDPNDVNVRRILDSAASVSLKTAALRRERELQELDRKRRLEEHEIRLGERSANPRS
ncbi:MAG: helix-turn-helix domain-containing protein [Hamadaea sp.]|nr:helix-turn-helix domain-containing protein [Hamadaea sp.]